MKLDLSQFRQNHVKDTAEDLAEIAALKQIVRIPEGIHEVVVTGIHEKDGNKFKITDKLGGTLGFSLVVQDAQKREQMIYICVPLVASYKQACLDPDKKVSFAYINSVRHLNCMKINPISLREAILASDCEAIKELVGAQFVIRNSWDSRKLHLEYDSTARAYYFVTSNGERFSSGEIAAPIELDMSKKDDSRFDEAVAIAHAQGYQLATRMDVKLDVHPTATNEDINESLKTYLVPKKQPTPTVINKTIPAFPKKVVAPLSVEPDVFQAD